MNENEKDRKNSSRRDLLRLASVASLGMSLSHAAPQQAANQATPTAGRTVSGMPFEKKDTVRLGVIGVGGRGNSLIDNFSAMPEVQVAALCDVVEDKVRKAQAKLERAGKQAHTPALYHSSDNAFEQLLKRDDLYRGPLRRGGGQGAKGESQAGAGREAGPHTRPVPLERQRLRTVAEARRSRPGAGD